jgi:hypothetical protein
MSMLPLHLNLRRNYARNVPRELFRTRIRPMFSVSTPGIISTPCFRRHLSFNANPRPIDQKRTPDERISVSELDGPKKVSVFARVLPPSIRPPPDSGASLRKLMRLAKPETRPLLIAVGLVSVMLVSLQLFGLTYCQQLTISSSVSMTVPFTIGRLIDYFASPNPVSNFSWYLDRLLTAFPVPAIIS